MWLGGSVLTLSPAITRVPVRVSAALEDADVIMPCGPGANPSARPRAVRESLTMRVPPALEEPAAAEPEPEPEPEPEGALGPDPPR